MARKDSSEGCCRPRSILDRLLASVPTSSATVSRLYPLSVRSARITLPIFIHRIFKNPVPKRKAYGANCQIQLVYYANYDACAASPTLNLHMHAIPSQSQPGPVEYIPRVISVLRDMDGVAKAKASAVRDAIVASMTEHGEPFNKTILSTGAIKYQNDIAWARMYLVNAGMLEPVKVWRRGNWKLTQAGWAMPLDVQTAAQIYNQPTGNAGIVSIDTQDAPSDDALQQDLPGTDSWEHQLKKILRSLPPEGFERLCAAIMTANGLHATKVNGHSGDKGIDGEGLLSFDKAGLVSIRVAWQCKRFKDGSVGSEAVRNFRGSLDHATAHGIIFTTSAFTPEAVLEAAQPSKQPIKLVDLGEIIAMLKQLELGVSVLPVSTIDLPFFDAYLNPVVSNPTKSLIPMAKAAPSAMCP